jgi:hypothetical protein
VFGQFSVALQEGETALRAVRVTGVAAVLLDDNVLFHRFFRIPDVHLNGDGIEGGAQIRQLLPLRPTAILTIYGTLETNDADEANGTDEAATAVVAGWFG